MAVPGAVLLVVLIVLSLALSVAGRHARTVGNNGSRPQEFVTEPLMVWLAILPALLLLVLNLVTYFHVFSSQPAPTDVPVFMYLLDLLLFGCVLVGVYFKTLRISVDRDDLCVATIFGRRITPLREIGSVVVKNSSQWRTLDVRDKRGRRLLSVTSSLRGFDDLADLLSEHTGSNG